FLCNTSICGSSLSISLPFGFACVPRDRVFEMYGLLSVATDAESYLLVRTFCSFNTSAPCNSSNSAQQTTPAPSSPASPPTTNAASLEPTPRAVAAGAVSLLGGIIIGALFPSVTGATLSPTAGGLPMIQGALGVLRLRRRCAAAAFDDDGTDGNSSEMTTQQLSVMDSPTQLCFDTLLGPQTACAAGAIVGNVALIVGVGCVIHVCAAFVRPWLRRSSSVVVVTSPSPGTPGEGNTATPPSLFSVLRACLHRHLPDDRLPGSAYWTFSSLL
ncbi:membrane-associated protein, putative, partial [Bodo saltans]